MKIAVTATGPDLDAKVDPRFGRCPYFLIVETDELSFEAVENPNLALGGGAGIQSARLMAEKGVKQVLTGNCGPNAYQTLLAAEIGVVVGCSGTVREVIEQYKAGHLTATAGPNVAGHFGISAPVPGPVGPQGAAGRAFSPGRGGGRGPGRGRGNPMQRGGGRGMGMGGGVQMPLPQGPAPTTQQPNTGSSKNRPDELTVLKQQAEQLIRQTERIHERISQLEGQASTNDIVATVDPHNCTGCGICVRVCPAGAIRLDGSVAVVEAATCTGCGLCVNECPNEAISMV